MKNLIRTVLLLCLLGQIMSATAQTDSLPPTVQLDTAILAIGDQTHLRITLPLEKGKTPVFPNFKDSIGHSLEILGKKIDTVKNMNGKTFITHDYLITSFDTGHIYIPPFEVGIAENGYNSTITTDTAKMYVATPTVDMEKGIFDIKPPADMPFQFQELYPLLKKIGLALTILILLIGILLYFLVFRKKKQENAQEIIDNRPAHIKANEALSALKDKQLWQQNLVKKYYSELTDILRSYLDERFDLQTMESTSSEIMQTLRKQDISKEDRENLATLFSLADMAKFAKGQPQAHENDKSWNDAAQFVAHTQPTETEIADKTITVKN